MAPGEIGMGAHGRQERLAKAFVAPRPAEGRDGLVEGIDGPPILALGLVG